MSLGLLDPVLHAVHSVTASLEEGVFIVNVTTTDGDGETYTCDYCSRPGDPNGLNPAIRAWLEANPA